MKTGKEELLQSALCADNRIKTKNFIANPICPGRWDSVYTDQASPTEAVLGACKDAQSVLNCICIIVPMEKQR